MSNLPFRALVIAKNDFVEIKGNEHPVVGLWFHDSDHVCCLGFKRTSSLEKILKSHKKEVISRL